MVEKRDLRRRAEERLRSLQEAEGSKSEAESGQLPSADDSLETGNPLDIDSAALLEDLRIHKAELEIQNQELREAQWSAESERERYRQLFEQLPVPAMVVDRIGVIQDANPAAAEYFGFRSVSGLRHHSLFRLIGEGGGERLSLRLGAGEEAANAATLSSVSLKAGEFGLSLADLSLIPLGGSYHLDRRELVVVKDRRQEQEHEQDRQLYETLLDNSSALIYAFGLDDRCLLWNARAARVFGCPRSAAVGELRADLLPPVEAEQSRALDRQVVEERRARTIEAQLPADEGQGAFHLVTRFPLRDSRGEIFGVGVIAGDISEFLAVRSRLEVALQVFNNGTEGVAILDDKRRVTYCNRAFQRMLGRTEREILGRSPVRFLANRAGERPMRAIQSALGHRDRWQGERWLRRLDGEVFPCWLRVSAVRGFDHSMSNFIVIADDITQQKSAEEEIERLAYYDGLTGTPNRHLLRDRVRQEIRASHRSGDEFALVFLDLDQFKDANDAFGHEFGDRLLIEFSRRLQRLVRENDTVSRLGGDEFVVLMPRIRRGEVVERVDSILAEAVRPFEINGEQVRLSASLGVAMFPGDAEDYDRLLKHADSAMYQAKKAGRNTYRFFDSKIAQEVEAHARMQQALRRALDQGDLTVAFQPQFALADRSLVGVEALVRWSDPEFGPVSPERFIPLAESGGMVQRLGEMVFDTVLDRIQEWRGTPFQHLQVSINVAPEQFWNPQFEQRLLERIRDADVSPAQVLLEITERTAMKDPDGLIQRMESLKAHGIELSIDDFGTGYSSLAYLQRFPLRQLKIDKSFVQRIGREKAGEQICRSVLQLAKNLGLEVVAEGVETEQQARFLREAGCEIGQGYLFARPMPAAELSDWMTAFCADR